MKLRNENERHIYCIRYLFNDGIVKVYYYFIKFIIIVFLVIMEFIFLKNVSTVKARCTLVHRFSLTKFPNLKEPMKPTNLPGTAHTPLPPLISHEYSLPDHVIANFRIKVIINVFLI